MRSSLARLSRALPAAFAAACLAAAFTPTRALAAHYVVDINGGGDFTTIGAAISACLYAPRETLLVMPGSYPETIHAAVQFFGPYLYPETAIVGVEGASVTRVASIMTDVQFACPTRVSGITFTGEVQVLDNRGYCFFDRCVFLDKVRAYGHGGPACFDDCDFYAMTEIAEFGSFTPFQPFRRLRFHGAMLLAHNAGLGSSRYEDCTFEGPAETLVEEISTEDPNTFVRCRFANAGTGMLCHFGGPGSGQTVSDCTFQDLSVAGIRIPDDDDTYDYEVQSSIAILGSRFERCGTAVRWVAPSKRKMGQVALSGDTILATVRNGVEIGRFDAVIANTIIDGSGGYGVAFFQTNVSGEDDVEERSYPTVWGSWITNNGADGVCIENTSVPNPIRTPAPAKVLECWLAFNGGAGARVTSKHWRVSGCRAYANGGDGIACTTTLPGLPSAAYSNTSAFNHGDGFRFSGPAAPGDSLASVHHNLAALNTGAGFRVPHESFGSFAFNDAWSNYMGQYVGPASPADSNLTVDPRFCDLGTGNLGLQQGSPCGASGVYGLIGGRPESCPNTAAVAPAASGGLAFAVRPSIARGSVEFVPPSAGPEGRIELFDLSGRRLWGAAFGPTTGTLRWQGQSDTGRARPGLYWVRFTRAGEANSQRLVWLE